MNDSSTDNETLTLQLASEEDLACRMQDGCADSFTELVKRLQPRLMFVLRRRLGHEADAEDVSQRTLLRAYEKIHLYDPAQKFSPWLFTIGLRLVIDYRRKKTLPTTDAEPSLTVVDPEPTPAQQAMHREHRDDLWSLAETVLKPDQWTALWLLYGEGQTVNEVAQSMNRSSVSVRVMLHRARKKLLPHLEKFAARSEQNTTANANALESTSTTLQVARAKS